MKVFKIGMSAPNDMSGLAELVDSGELDPRNVIAIIAKTEGNGLVNDLSRPFAETEFKRFFADALQVSTDEIADRISMVMSGGCPGLMSPHATVFASEEVDEQPTGEKRLCVGVAHSEEILPEEIGRMGQIHKVAAAVRKAMESAKIDTVEDVHFVQVKNPLLTKARIVDAKTRGKDVVTEDTGIGYFGSMCFANDASALGVGLATGEIPEDKLSDEAVRRDFSLYSNVSSTSSGGEKSRAEVVVMGNSENAAGDLCIGHSVMRDLIDSEGVREALRSAGLDVNGAVSDAQRERIVNVFAKAVVSGSGLCRNRRFTMLDDSDIGTKPARAIGNAVIASVVGDTMVYVSGGETDSHSGPPDGNPIAAIVRV